jgi:excisionase family DNA binding protein
MQQMFAVREIVHRLGVSPISIYRAVERGDLRGVRLGGRPSAPIRIYATDVERYLRPTRDVVAKPGA